MSTTVGHRGSETRAHLTLGRLSALAERANQDPDFAAMAARFSGGVRLICDEESADLWIDRGVVTGVSIAKAWQCSIELAGDSATWIRIWRGLPGGLHRAWRHKLLEFRGDPQIIFAYWKMIWRLGELMAASGWGD